jgi:2-oxoglutarate dehydrogenase E1 component
MSERDTPDGPWEVNPSNLSFVEDLYLAFLADPTSVDQTWRARFAAMAGQDPGARLRPPATPSRPAAPPPAGAAPALAAGNGHPAPAAARAPETSPPAPTQAPTRPVNGHAPAASGEPGQNGHDRPTAAGLGELAAAAAQRALTGKRVRRLIEDYREMGHLSARLDPLGLNTRRAAGIRLADYGLHDADLDSLVEAEGIAQGRPVPLRELIELLEETYCRHIGVELAHIYSNDVRAWLQARMESTRNRVSLSRAEQLQLLTRVTEAEVFEQFLQTKFLGAKRFSLEGAESAIPILDRIIERSSRAGVTQIVIGMAHRGRLNVLANVMGKPPAEIFSEFLDRATDLRGDPGGDVKYHLGYSSDRDTAFGRVHISLSFNPSHLEWVNTVVQGRMRGKQDRIGDRQRVHGLPILIHGDAAFAGQGVVAEALNMSGLDAYHVGGTIHVVINNQIGFTTSPRDAYPTNYPTDVARMLPTPIIHINGEDPEAIAQAVDLAVDFRQAFHRDVIIDMWCYRKLGHNEADEPAFTQPLMYKAIAGRPPPRLAYLEHFAHLPRSDQGGPITSAEAEEIAASKRHSLEQALVESRRSVPPGRPSTFAGVWSRVRGGPDSAVRDVETVVSREAIAAVGQALSTVPPDFTPHPKLVRLLKDRAAMAAGDKPLDWGMGELLALGTLLGEGVRVRMSGQDVRRGTFSHRHAVLVDYVTGAEYTPLCNLAQRPGEQQGTLEIRDSGLSEAGSLGFEYGYSLDMPEGLVVWEAQFGDFVNGAQVIIDQFLVSSEAKWNRVSGLVLLLPHGMEGQGPEHSSGRLERFLNMCVNDNMQVCNVTTPAQFFHLLRRQVMRPYRKPLIVMSPKSLLRHPAVVSSVAELTEGHFQHIIPDATVDPPAVERVLLCTGKVYYDLLAARELHAKNDVAIIRVEQLYPLHTEEILENLASYPEGIRVTWVQEEARNMGAWTYMNRVLPSLLLTSFKWSGVSRPLSASPATGSLSRHNLEHAKLLEEALGLGPGAIVVDKGQIKKGPAA